MQAEKLKKFIGVGFSHRPLFRALLDSFTIGDLFVETSFFILDNYNMLYARPFVIPLLGHDIGTFFVFAMTHLLVTTIASHLAWRAELHFAADVVLHAFPASFAVLCSHATDSIRRRQQSEKNKNNEHCPKIFISYVLVEQNDKKR